MNRKIRNDKVLNNLKVVNDFTVPIYTTLGSAGEGNDGNIILDLSTNTFYGNNGLTWISLAGGGAGSQTLQQTLLLGNETNGEDLIVSNGDDLFVDGQLTITLNGNLITPSNLTTSNTGYIKVTGFTGFPVGDPGSNGGHLAWNESTGDLYIHTGSGMWSLIGSGGGGSINLQNVGSGSGTIYVTGSSSPYQFRTLRSPLNTISIVTTPTEILLESTGIDVSGGSISLTSLYTPQPLNRVHVSQLVDAGTNWEPTGTTPDQGNSIYLHGTDETIFNRYLRMYVDDITGSYIQTALNSTYGNRYPGVSESVAPQVFDPLLLNFNDLNLQSGGNLNMVCQNGGTVTIRGGSSIFGSECGNVNIKGGDDQANLGNAGNVFISSGESPSGTGNSQIILYGPGTSAVEGTIEFYTSNSLRVTIDKNGDVDVVGGPLNVRNGNNVFLDSGNITTLGGNLTIGGTSSLFGDVNCVSNITTNVGTSNIGIDATGNVIFNQNSTVVITRPIDNAFFKRLTPFSYPPPGGFPASTIFNCNLPSARLEFTIDAPWQSKGRVYITIENTFCKTESMVFFSCFSEDTNVDANITVIRRSHVISSNQLNLVLINNNEPLDNPSDIPEETTFYLDFYIVDSNILP